MLREKYRMYTHSLIYVCAHTAQYGKTESDAGFHECIKQGMNPVRPALELRV